MSEPSRITFERGYRRLQEIADEVNQTEVPVDRMADLFAEGKGLDRALTDHLTEQKTRIERIERGEDIKAFRVVAPADERQTPVADVPSDTSALSSGPGQNGGARDEDIPF